METTTTNPTIFTLEYLESTVIEKQQRINELEGKLISLGHRREHTQNEMQAWTLDELDSCGINQDQAEAIAEICGFELTKEFEVEITVTYSATVKARNEEDAEYAINDIDFDTVSYNTDVITYMSSNIDNVNI